MSFQYKTIKIIFGLLVISVLAACGPKDVQPLQSLSDLVINDVRVAKVNVELSPEYQARLDESIAKEQDKIAQQNERIVKSAEASRRKQRDIKFMAEQEIEKSEKKIARLKEEMAVIPNDVKAGIVEVLENKFSGNRQVDVEVLVNSFSLTNGAAVVLIGGSDSMSGVMKIYDSNDQTLLGEYHISDMDTNGGLIGLMARGSDPRSAMIKQFAEKVSGVLSGEYAD